MHSLTGPLSAVGAVTVVGKDRRYGAQAHRAHVIGGISCKSGIWSGDPCRALRPSVRAGRLSRCAASFWDHVWRTAPAAVVE